MSPVSLSRKAGEDVVLAKRMFRLLLQKIAPHSAPVAVPAAAAMRCAAKRAFRSICIVKPQPWQIIDSWLGRCTVSLPLKISLPNPVPMDVGVAG
jgi:hypothetical protein